MDSEVFGPYTAKSMMELDVLPDIMVTEDSLSTWEPAEKFNFAALAKEEVLERLKASQSNEKESKAISDEEKRELLKERLKRKKGPCFQSYEQATSTPIANSFPNQIEYKANYNEGINSIGGKIIITPTQLIFHPHSINFGDLHDRIFEISKISGYEKGMFSFLHILFNDGNRIKLTVWHKSEIINQLESRRISLLK